MQPEEYIEEEEAAWRRYLKAEVKEWADSLAAQLRKDWSNHLSLDVVYRFMACDRQAEALLWQCKNKVGEQLQDYLQAYGSKFCEWLARTWKGLGSDLTAIREGLVQRSAAVGAISMIHMRLKNPHELHFNRIEEFLTWLGSYIWTCYRVCKEEGWPFPSLDEPGTSEEEEGETKLEQLAAPDTKTPEKILLKEKIQQRKVQWIENFLSFLGQTVQRTHLEADITAAKETNQNLELAYVVDEVLTFLEGEGRRRSKEDKERIIELCCSKGSEDPNRSYNLHEYRLRERWAVFKQLQRRKGFELLPSLSNEDDEDPTEGKGDSNEE